MAFIRVGFFETFKSADTLLIDVDHECLPVLIAWLQLIMSSGLKTAISSCPQSAVQSGLQVVLLRAADDVGIVRTAVTEFIWQRSDEGWAEVIDKLATMRTGSCHQYLDGPRDAVQVMASIGEYGDAWWQRKWGLNGAPASPFKKVTFAQGRRILEQSSERRASLPLEPARQDRQAP